MSVTLTPFAGLDNSTVENPEALYLVGGSGTDLDGKLIRAVALVDPTTGAASSTVESNHYGTPSAGTAVTVGATSTAVLAPNSSRKLLVLTNDSANTIYVDLSGAAAVVGQGVRLNANGGAVVLDRYVPTSAIKAIATSASSALCVQEG